MTIQDRIAHFIGGDADEKMGRAGQGAWRQRAAALEGEDLDALFPQGCCLLGRACGSRNRPVLGQEAAGQGKRAEAEAETKQPAR